MCHGVGPANIPALINQTPVGFVGLLVSVLFFPRQPQRFVPGTFGSAVVEMKGFSRQLFLARIGVRSFCRCVACEMQHFGRLSCTPESSPVAVVHILATAFGFANSSWSRRAILVSDVCGFPTWRVLYSIFVTVVVGNRIGVVCPANEIAYVFAQSAQLRKMRKANGT